MEAVRLRRLEPARTGRRALLHKDENGDIALAFRAQGGSRIRHPDDEGIRACPATPTLPSPDGTRACPGSAICCASRAGPTCGGGGIKGGGAKKDTLK